MRDDIYRGAEAPECLAAYADRVGLDLKIDRDGCSYERGFVRGGAYAMVRGQAPDLQRAIAQARPQIDRMFAEGWT